MCVCVWGGGEGEKGLLGLIFVGYVPLVSQSLYPIIVYSVGILVTCGQIRQFARSQLRPLSIYVPTLYRMKKTLLFTYSTNILVRLLTVNMKNCLTPKNPKMCDPILVTLLKMRPHYSQSSCENATSSGGTFQLASYKEVPPSSPSPPPPSPGAYDFYLALKIGYKQNTHSKIGAENSLFQF